MHRFEDGTVGSQLRKFEHDEQTALLLLHTVHVLVAEFQSPLQIA